VWFIFYFQIEKSFCNYVWLWVLVAIPCKMIMQTGWFCVVFYAIFFSLSNFVEIYGMSTVMLLTQQSHPPKAIQLSNGATQVSKNRLNSICSAYPSVLNWTPNPRFMNKNVEKNNIIVQPLKTLILCIGSPSLWN